jgi:hypothetical protein
MATIRDFIDGLAEDLADAEPGYEFQTWSEGHLLRLVNEARCLVYQLSPERFAQVVTVPLESCKAFQTGGCDNVIKVLEQVDALGCTIGKVVEKSVSKFRFTWNRPGCSTGSDYTVDSAWTVDGAGGFFIDPPPPAGVTAYVNVLCASGPNDLELDDESTLGCDEKAWITPYVLFRALSVDTESAGHKSVADTYYKVFLDVIGLSNKADSKFKLASSYNDGVMKK